MSKDPAFLFYPNDWLGGTLGMTFEEKGAYIELLMLQFNRGHMTIHMIGQTVGQLWDKIQDKFTQDEQGLYYNKRLELEVNKRKAYCSSRRNNIEGNNQHSNKEGHKGGHTSSHMIGHMENENINENIDINNKGGTGGRFKPPTVEDVQAYCSERNNKIDAESFVNFYASKGWKVGNTPMKDWKACVRTWEAKDKQNRGSPPEKPTGTGKQLSQVV